MATRTSALAIGRGRKGSDAAATTSISAVKSHPALLLGIVVGALVLLGLVMILSASTVQSFASYGSSFHFFKRQLLWAALGVAGFTVFARLDYKRLKGFGYLLLPGVMFLLFLVVLPGVGIVSGGSARWIGFGPVAFQPSEFAKVALILFAADVLSRKEERSLTQLSHTLLPIGPALLVLVALVMKQPDMGTTMMLVAIAFGLLFVAGAPLSYLITGGVLGTVAATAAALSAEYRRERVLAFLDPWADPLNTGYHTIQSLIAMGSGGWFGVGLGASRQKWSYIPNAHTDFIFSIIGEEMGLVGTFMVLGLFAFLVYLGIRIARAAPDRFGTLVASGITIWIGVQALVNMGAVTATMPVTGVPLPLVSFGGSSLLVCLCAMGILTNIARQGRWRTRTDRKA